MLRRVISRFAATASALLGFLSAAIVWRLAVSPDSDLKVGIIVTSPFVALAVGLGLLAFWTRRPTDRTG